MVYFILRTYKNNIHELCMYSCSMYLAQSSVSYFWSFIVVTIELQGSSKTARVPFKNSSFLFKEKEKVYKSSTRIHPVPSTSKKFWILHLFVPWIRTIRGCNIRNGFCFPELICCWQICNGTETVSFHTLWTALLHNSIQ